MARIFPWLSTSAVGRIPVGLRAGNLGVIASLWRECRLAVEPAAARLVENLLAPDAWLFSSGFAVFLAVSYFFVYVFKKHLFVPKEHP